LSVSKKTFKTIDEYIALFPKDVRNILEALRKAIRDVAPQAEEGISYQIPTYKLNGNLVHFAAFKDHISFFPTSSGIEAFKVKLKSYKTSKGTIRFPLDEPIPFDLIEEIVMFRVKENLSKNNSDPKV
jgi:uncharacterized protein YdhG (YjbR/CyaY superfamily)